jgi:hypothetical protein
MTLILAGGYDEASSARRPNVTGRMSSHPAEIAGFDPKRPPLAQLDKLTDAQLRTVARALDPIAK